MVERQGSVLTLHRLDDADAAPLEVPPGRSITIGAARRALADVRIDSPLVARRQAVVEGGDDGWWIEDAGSVSGTYLNDARLVERTALADGDELRLGGVRCRVRIR